MLVRELFQHANAGQGEIENSRIMHVGPFTRWAVLGYGNDFHLIHHIYPNIPCYRLREVHDLLVQRSPECRRAVKETHGIRESPSASGKSGKRSLLDDLARVPERQVPSSANAKPHGGSLPSSPAGGKRL